MTFIDTHFTALICLAYTGIGAWLINRIVVAVVTAAAASNFSR
jgi:hypothetical protein